MQARLKVSRAIGVLTAVAVSGMLHLPAASAEPVSGAIFTTDATCGGTNVNIFGTKDAVYLDGGPAHTGAAGLPDGNYYVRVTDPSGATVLGTSGLATPVSVSGGEFAMCYQLSALVGGYADTPNAGGEYKVWVSLDMTFVNSSTKTDNFKVRDDSSTPGLDQATLDVVKFYDANANGINDDGQPITGWQVRIQDGIDFIRYTPVHMIVAPDTYTVTESAPVETNWQRTTANPVVIPLANAATATVEFGNLCLGAGGGLTLGFWSNKNGEKLMDGTDLAMLTALNLRNANGTPFDPATYSAFRTWILGATATNMAYMLSAQLAAMELNVFNGKVSGGSLIYAPGATSANSLGYATVNAVMAEANTSLGTDANTTSAGPARTYQEALKNALDRANNNLNFVQATPCAFSFATV